MARAQPLTNEGQSLYERDFCLWIEEQARLLREGRLANLDVVNLLDEIESLAIDRKHAVASDLVVVLKHLLKHQHQPRRRSRSSLSSLAEHRRRLGREFQHAPSLREYARAQFEQCYQDGRRQALIETGLAPDTLPSAPPYSLEQTLDPDFLPDCRSPANRLDDVPRDPWRHCNWRDSIPSSDCDQEPIGEGARCRSFAPSLLPPWRSSWRRSAPGPPTSWCGGRRGSTRAGGQAVTEIIAAFEQDTGKEVELVNIPDGEIEDKAQAAIEAGHPPDFLFGIVVE